MEQSSGNARDVVAAATEAWLDAQPRAIELMLPAQHPRRARRDDALRPGVRDAVVLVPRSDACWYREVGGDNHLQD
jgi:hypothetical protein